MWCDFTIEGKTKIKSLYTCYSANGSEYTEEITREGKLEDFINEYGKDTMNKLLDNYIEKEVARINKQEFKNIAETYKAEIFSNNVLEDEMEY